MAVTRRVQQGLRAVLPPGVALKAAGVPGDSGDVVVHVAGRQARVRWLDRGTAKLVEQAAKRRPVPDLVMAHELSQSGLAAARAAGVGWLDESGGAEFALGHVVVARSSDRPRPAPRRLVGWTPATLGVAEALLIGVTPTVKALREITRASPSTVGTALNFLTRSGMLTAVAARGRHSGRSVTDRISLLEAYADAVNAMPATLSVPAGVLWREPLGGLEQVGRLWDAEGVEWAATGALSAAVIAPYQTQVAPMVVYLDATTLATLVAAARTAGLKTLNGGRLSLRPFPSQITRRLSTQIGPGLRSVPWPRIYADLRDSGARGEGAAEHLLEVVTRDER